MILNWFKKFCYNLDSEDRKRCENILINKLRAKFKEVSSTSGNSIDVLLLVAGSVDIQTKLIVKLERMLTNEEWVWALLKLKKID